MTTPTPLVLPGKATLECTQHFLNERYAHWNYQASWQAPVGKEHGMNTRIGLEFRTSDIPHIRQNIEQLILMGCNHFQWNVGQAEELAFVDYSPFFDYFQDEANRLTTRNGVFFSLRLPRMENDKTAEMVKLAAKKLGLEQWDRIVLSEISETLANISGLTHFSEHPEGDHVFWTEDQKSETLAPLQIALNHSHLLSFFDEPAQALWIQFLQKESFPFSFNLHTPMDVETSVFSPAVSSDTIEIQQQNRQTILALLGAVENKLNSDLKKWQEAQKITTSLDPFAFIHLLREACRSLESAEQWEHYLSNSWFPPFQHHVRSWSLQIPETLQKQWRWNVREYMAKVHELMSVQNRCLRMDQTERLRPLHIKLRQRLPEFPTELTFGAQLLFFLASVSSAETLFFPWKTLDSAIEFLGLMRFPFQK